jgi:preprotein translocase subunit SecD
VEGYPELGTEGSYSMYVGLKKVQTACIDDENEPNNSMDEAKEISVVLRAGALPAPVHILEERSVGPLLGKDSIQRGFRALIVGFVSVMLFMGIYYSFSGLIAILALLLNLIFIVALLAGFHATLTMPGMAGLILTVGMAVDANVLIFERIREELRAGKTPKSAVDNGYARAMITILDANLTTLIAALVLLRFGTGPIRGFAVVLSLGIVVSFFTAIFVTKIVFDYLISVRRVRKISI